MTVFAAALCLAIGFASGLLFFALLSWNIWLYLSSGSLWCALAVQAARIAAVGGLLLVAALHGALPLLMTALGLLVARPVAVHSMTRATT